MAVNPDYRWAGRPGWALAGGAPVKGFGSKIRPHSVIVLCILVWMGVCNLLVLGCGSYVVGVESCVSFVIGSGLFFPKLELLPNWDTNQHGGRNVTTRMTLTFVLSISQWLPP